MEGRTMSERDPDGWEQWRGAAMLGDRVRSPESDLFPHTALTEDMDVEQALDVFAAQYDPALAAQAVERALPEGETVEPDDMPATAEQHPLYRRVKASQESRVLSKAVHEGDAQTQSYALGEPDSGDSIEGIESMEWLQEWLTQPAPIGYCFGPPNAGKTNAMVLLARLWKRWAGENAVLLSNISTLEDADKWVPSFASLERALDQQVDERDDGGIVRRDDAVPMLVLLDEASSDMSGRGADGAQAGRLMGPLTYKIRKYNAGLLVVGHDGRDVHPAMRVLATVFEKKRQEQKTMRVFEDVRDRQGVGHIQTLTGVPKAGGYDDGEATSWSWDEQDDRDDESGLTMDEARSLAEDMVEDEVRDLAVALDEDPHVDLKQGEIGRVIGEAYRGDPFKQNTISTWVNDPNRERVDDSGETGGEN
jgi:hypothetical protein